MSEVSRLALTERGNDNQGVWGHPDQWQGKDSRERESLLRERLRRVNDYIAGMLAADAADAYMPPLAEILEDIQERANG